MIVYGVEQGGHAKYHIADHLPITYIGYHVFLRLQGKAIFAQKNYTNYLI
jgi:hypothetical protein